MIEVKQLEDIAGAENGWLRAKHHFAIGTYGNPAHLPMESLYVFNDDEISPHSGEALPIGADAEVRGALVEGGSFTDYSLGRGDAAYLVPASGSVSVNGVRVGAREGLVIRAERILRIEALMNAEVVLIVTEDRNV